MKVRGLAKHVHAEVAGLDRRHLLKVLALDEARASELPEASILTWDDALQEGACDSLRVARPREAGVIRSGDVIRVTPGRSLVSILYRRGSRANVLFTTERCNSLCLMCSQPPRDTDDSWRVNELLSLIPLIDKDEPQLGITGGEPTLLGDGLVRILEACGRELPCTHLHLLTNGRCFGDARLARALVGAGGARTTWAVPLYADVPARHDEIVGAPGAFAETVLGLAELASRGARVEIRVVLHALSLPRLPELADFIYRRLPFAEHVALMGLEPMGFAKGNRDRLWIDPADYLSPLGQAAHHLANRGMDVSIYNLPLCVLPRDLWRFARQSISDWKNTFPDTCEGCTVLDRCAGFFASAGPAWRSRLVSPVLAVKEAAL